jgi:hypothetical protein
MPLHSLMPQKIGAHMLERGGHTYTTAQGDTVYVLGEQGASAQLMCFASGEYRLHVCIEEVRKQANTALHMTKLWSWWLAHYDTEAERKHR